MQSRTFETRSDAQFSFKRLTRTEDLLRRLRRVTLSSSDSSKSENLRELLRESSESIEMRRGEALNIVSGVRLPVPALDESLLLNKSVSILLSLFDISFSM